MQLLKLIVLFFLAYAVCASSSPSSSEPLPVYTARAGSSIFDTHDYFDMTHSQKGKQSYQRNLFNEKLFLVTSLPPNSKETVVLHTVTLSHEDESRWRSMIQSGYRYRFSVAGFWPSGLLGEVVRGTEQVYSHKKFIVKRDGDRLIDVELVPEKLVELKPNTSITFTYSVSTFEPDQKDQQSYGIYVLFSLTVPLCLLAVCLWVFVLLPLSKSSQDDDATLLFRFSSWSSWKLLSSDVFRRGNTGPYLCAFAGSGAHYLSFLLVSLCSYKDVFQFSGFLVFQLSYLLGGVVCGFLLMSSCLQFQKRKTLTKCFILQFILTQVPFITVSLLDFFRSVLSIGFHGALHQLITSTLTSTALGFPTLFIGMLLGRHAFITTNGRRSAHHVNQVPRIIPASKSKIQCNILLLLSGFFPYLAISVSYNRFLSCVFLFHGIPSNRFILGQIVVVAVSIIFVSVIGTFCILNEENHRWKWKAFGFGSSYSIYLSVHSLLFYLIHIKLLQIPVAGFYLCFTGAIVYYMALMGGFLSFSTALFFVEYIYTKKKKIGLVG